MANSQINSKFISCMSNQSLGITSAADVETPAEDDIEPEMW